MPAVVPHDLDRVFARVCAGERVQQQHPQIVTDHDDHDDLEEHRELLGDRSLICQTAEGGGDEERQQRDDDLGDDGQNDVLDFVEQRLQALDLVQVIARPTISDSASALMTFMIAGISSWNSTSGSSFRPSTCETMDRCGMMA